VSETRKPRLPEIPRGFDGHRRAQAGFGLRLTPVERLRWLEETMAALRRWRGRARAAGRVSEPTDES
jgi:hypothetical protein